MFIQVLRNGEQIAYCKTADESYHTVERITHDLFNRHVVREPGVTIATRLPASITRNFAHDGT